jgi:hypothetical protein
LNAAILRCGLPPVPHVSIKSPSTGNGSAASSMAASSPHISSCDAPFIRRATRKPLICDAVASPAMIDPITAAASA